MRSGFTFKGIHSSKFGITAKTKSRPALPEMKYSSVESPLIDGVYDFSAANEYGHAFYNDRFFEIQIQAAADNLRELDKKVSKIAVWLKGSGELQFDDMPLVKFNCSVISEMGFVPEHYGKTTVMTAVFRAKPFGACIFDTVSGPELNSEMELDTNIPIDILRANTWSFTGGNNAYSEVNKLLKIVNAGNVYASPVIRIDGLVKNVSIACGSKSLYINAQKNGFIIDCKKQTVTDLNGNSVMANFSGSFPELKEGVSDMLVSMYVNNDASVSIEYTPRFVYDCDFDYADWGECNA